MNKLLTCLLLFLISIIQGQETNIPPAVYGMYGSPTVFWDKGYHLDELGVNAIFVRGSSISQPIVERARAEGLKVYIEFPTLNGKGYVETHPEAWAINERGGKVEAAGWFMGVCPTEPGFKAYRQEQLKKLLKQYALDGVWLDYVHWHAQFEEPEPILPETCFCERCLEAFQVASDIELPQGDIAEKATWILSHKDSTWRDWRCQVIVDWVKELKGILAKEQPEALLGLYHCPWADEDFDGARRRILGLDYGLLNDHVDVFSPMVYHERMGRSARWVEENLNWFRNKLKSLSDDRVTIWPIVQAHQVPTAEFKRVLKAGLSAGSSGVMMFTGNAVAEEKTKIEVMQEIYEQVKGKE